MVTEEQIQKAKTFAGLHYRPEILVLPNAWNAGSARILASAGFKAIGTTSAGIAFSLGLPDGEKMAWENNLSVLRQICAAIDMPVTADIESGYGDLNAVVSAAIEAGAIGVNIEDSIGLGRELTRLSDAVDTIRRARAVADNNAFPLFINARIDGIMLKKEGLEQTIERGRAYRAAGADSIFVPRVVERADIHQLVRRIDAPVNILATPASPTVKELQELGVARVSIGGSLARAVLTFIHTSAIELRDHGSYRFAENIFSQEDVNRLFE